MKNIIELQRKTAQLTEDINDVLHAANLNFQALVVQAKQMHSTLPNEFSYLHSLLVSMQKLMGERSQLHMGYLITKQIQEEEERVRRERLADYEEKIYDQRRIISDKEGFFESLLRPKKKRLQHQTAEEFQQIRAKEKESEERAKTELLLKELSDIQALKRLIEAQERDSCLNNRKHEEKVKNCSISNVNSTAMSVNQNGEFPTEKILPIIDQRGNQSSHGHNRSNSLQHSIVREAVTVPNDEIAKAEESNLADMTNEILNFKAENEELHHIYDQQCLALKFKKGQCAKLMGDYQRVSKELVETREKLNKVKEEQKWRYQRCSRPVSPVRRPSSSGQR